MASPAKGATGGTTASESLSAGRHVPLKMQGLGPVELTCTE